MPFFSGFDLFEPSFHVLLVAGRQIFEAAFLFQSRDPLWCGMEVQPERAFNRDLVEAKIRIVEDFADDVLALHRQFSDRVLLGEASRFSIFKVAVDTSDISDMIWVVWFIGWITDPSALVTEAFLHLLPEVASVNELNLSLRSLTFLLVSTHM